MHFNYHMSFKINAISLGLFKNTNLQCDLLETLNILVSQIDNNISNA